MHLIISLMPCLSVYCSSLFADAAVSCGALGNLSDAMTLMSDVPKLVKTKNNQLEEFCAYRVRYTSHIPTYVMSMINASSMVMQWNWNADLT